MGNTSSLQNNQPLYMPTHDVHIKDITRKYILTRMFQK